MEGEALTCVAAAVAHVGGDQAPLVRGRVVELHRGQVAGAVVPADHVQKPVNGAHPCNVETASDASRRETKVTHTRDQRDGPVLENSEIGRASCRERV